MRKIEKSSLNSKDRKKHIFKNHLQFGGRCPFEVRRIEIRRFDENLTRYFASFEQHSDYYNLYDHDEIIENFLNLFLLKFVPKPNLNKVKINANISILNFQPSEKNGFVEIRDSRI